MVEYAVFCCSTYCKLLRIGYYPGKRATSVLLHEEWMYARGKAELGQHSSPRATKLMLHAFLGSNLLVSFYFAAMASFKVTYLLIA